MKPYTDTKHNSNSWIREFAPDVDNHELVWHRDKKDRIVKVLDGDGWIFQMDEEVPCEMKRGDILNVPKETYHRLYKSGVNTLRIQITE